MHERTLCGKLLRFEGPSTVGRLEIIYASAAVHVVKPRRRDAARRFLLERVQDVNRIGETDRVHRSERIASVPLDQLDYPTAAESLQRLRIRMPAPALREAKSKPDRSARRLGELA